MTNRRLPHQQSSDKFEPKKWNPDCTDYAPRQSSSTWDRFRDMLFRWHGEHVSRPEMLKRLNEEGFHPSKAQLDNRMNGWELRVRSRKPKPSRAPRGLSIGSKGKDTEPGLSGPLSELRSSNILSSSTNECTIEEVFSELVELCVPCVQSEEQSPPEDLSGYASDRHHVRNLSSGTDSSESQASTLVEDPLDPPRYSEYCSQACCENSLDYHRRLVAADFLTSLQCWDSAASLLLELIQTMKTDRLVSVSDRVWVKLAFSRVERGSLFNPDYETSISSTTNWHDMAEPLNDYIQSSQSQCLPSPLAHLCLVSQYRRAGSFRYYSSAASNLVSPYGEVQLLANEMSTWEQETKVLHRLAMWSNEQLGHITLQKALMQLSVHLDHHRTLESLQTYTFPRIVACHLMSQWIKNPLQRMLDTLQAQRHDFGPHFALDVFLPEAFVCFSQMLLARCMHVQLNLAKFSDFNYVLRFVQQMRKTLEDICCLGVSAFCLEFAQNILSIYSRSSDPQRNVSCKFSDKLTARTAHQIMNKGYVSRFGCEKANQASPSAWMPLPSCFKVHGMGSARPSSEKERYVTARSLLAANAHEEILQPHVGRYTSGSNSVTVADVSTQTVESVLPPNQASHEPLGTSGSNTSNDKVHVLLRCTNAFKPSRQPIYRSDSTDSTSRRSLASIKATGSRHQAYQAALQTGIAARLSVPSSNGSRSPAMASEYNLFLADGIEPMTVDRMISMRTNSSCSPDAMSVTRASPVIAALPFMDMDNAILEQSNQRDQVASLQDLLTGEEPQTDTSVNSRHYSPMFLMDASRDSGELLLIEFQEPG